MLVKCSLFVKIGDPEGSRGKRKRGKWERKKEKLKERKKETGNKTENGKE